MEKSITLSASRAEKISVQITQRDLGFAIREVAAEMCGNPDDAGVIGQQITRGAPVSPATAIGWLPRIQTWQLSSTQRTS